MQAPDAHAERVLLTLRMCVRYNTDVIKIACLLAENNIILFMKPYNFSDYTQQDFIALSTCNHRSADSSQKDVVHRCTASLHSGCESCFSSVLRNLFFAFLFFKQLNSLFLKGYD